TYSTYLSVFEVITKRTMVRKLSSAHIDGSMSALRCRLFATCIPPGLGSRVSGIRSDLPAIGLWNKELSKGQEIDKRTWP
ncbi:hypothetical protein HAX54_045354, partial [Datura stramonium]|nr:hypothetical protein [Datura stramonium]